MHNFIYVDDSGTYNYQFGLGLIGLSSDSQMSGLPVQSRAMSYQGTQPKCMNNERGALKLGKQISASRRPTYALADLIVSDSILLCLPHSTRLLETMPCHVNITCQFRDSLGRANKNETQNGARRSRNRWKHSHESRVTSHTEPIVRAACCGSV